MFPVIDFRNGRYQGQTKNQLPNGFGCFMDRNFLFCIGQWVAGEVQGNAIIIIPSGTIFYGRLNYRKMHEICFFELSQDHVQLITSFKTQNRQRYLEKTAAILPLFQTILEIESNDSRSTVLKEYEYSRSREETNERTISNILNLERKDSKGLQNCNNFIQYFQTVFYSSQQSIFEFLILNTKGKKQYFLGIKGQGLGIKVEPTEEIGLNMKKTGRVYFIRGMGYFTKDNQLKDIGMKMIDNSMKGVIYEQGVYSMPSTIIKYEKGRRPVNCSANFQSYIKRSLYYRDKFLDTDYLYALESFANGFNENLRKVETEKAAQNTIENPKPLFDKQNKKYQNQRPIYNSKQTVFQPPQQNPYNPVQGKVFNPEYNLGVATNDIYRSASKKKYIRPSEQEFYKKTEYVDPNYRIVERDFNFVPIWKRESPQRYREPPIEESYPLKMDYRRPDEDYNYEPPSRQRPKRYSPTKNYLYNPPSDPYPNSLYPQRAMSPLRPARLSPKNKYYYDYQQPFSNEYDHSYDYRR